MAGPPPSTTEDIRKMAHLIKIKTNKRKYFVLRDESKASSARLEYYDSEKKFRNGHAPKRSIVLKNCFNINSKPDAKHKYAIALYTQDDCFAIACVSEDEQQEWLSTMIELRSRNIDENSEARPLFEHMWPVTVKSRGLGGSERKVIPGQYRLCLTNKDLSLIRTMKNDQSDIVLPLDCIRRCGHTHQFFFLELGRSAKTGSGNLWLQVEDNVIAQNIHEALLSSMKNNEVPAPGIFRIRSGSSATEKGRKRTSLMSTGGSSSLQPKRSHSIYTSNPSPKPSHVDARSIPFAGNVSPVEGAASGTACARSPPSEGTIIEEAARPDDYMTITPGAVDHSLKPPPKFTSLRPSSEMRVDSSLFSRSPGHVTDAIPGSISSKTLVVATSSSGPDWTSGSSADYVPMVTPNDERYMEMKTRRTDDTAQGAVSEEHGSNSSVSSVISSVGSMSITESSERSFHSLSQLQEIPNADAGYIEMASPQNYNEQPGLGIVRPDVVPCYVRDESAEDFPKRAYSVGSKPVPVPNKPLNNSYIDMSGRSKTKDPEKSSSAPHLNDDDEKKKELSDLFMELDFHRGGKRDVGHKDQLSRGKEFRERASSGGSRELRMKAMSFSTKEAIQKLSIFGRNRTTTAGGGQHADGKRPRTSTICQESLRPRMSSFGQSDLRPRSSSGGNACFLDVVSKQMQSGQSSQDSLRRRGSKRSSQESVDSGKGDPYMDMNMSRRSSDRLSKMAEADAGYIDMKPGDDASSNYMQMTAGAPTSSGSGAGLGTSGVGSGFSSGDMMAPTRAVGGIIMRPKLEVVKAGSGDDYLEMVAEGSGGSSSSQSKPRSSVASVQPRPRATKSLVETGSNYLEMAPVSLSSAGKKESSAPAKYADYMEMSVGSTHTGPSSVGPGAQTQIRRASSNPSPQVAQANHLRCSDKRETSVTPKVTSPKKDDRRNCSTQQQQPQHHPGSTARDAPPQAAELDVPPPPFDLSIPLHSFLHYSDRSGENTPTIPSQSATTSRTPHPSMSGTAADSLDVPVQAQISYATLDLGTSAHDGTGVPVSDGKAGGVSGRGRGFMPGSSHHVYAQIDFGKSDDHSK